MANDTAPEYRVLVIDDERPARKRLQSLIDSLAGYQWVGEAANGSLGLQQAVALRAEIVLLDISMPDIDGLQLAAKLAELARPPAVIFCTAHDQHALAAFTAQAGAYLLKPVKSEQLLTALQRVSRLNRAQRANSQWGDVRNPIKKKSIATPAVSAYLLSKSARGEERVEVAEVAALIASHKYVSAYRDNREIILDSSLKNLEQAYGTVFIRVHRNALVSRLHLTAIDRGEQNGQFRAVLRGSEVAPLISRRHLPAVRRALREQHSPILCTPASKPINKQ